MGKSKDLEFSQRLSSEKGSVMAEASLTMFIFLLVVFGFIEMLIFVYGASVVQFSLDRTVRNLSIKQAATVSDIKTSVLNAVQRLGIGLDIAPTDISVCADFSRTCAGTESRGRPEGYFTVTVRLTLNAIVFPISLPMTRTVFVRNE